MYKNSMKMHNSVIILIRGSLLVELNFDLKVVGSKWRHVPIKTEGALLECLLNSGSLLLKLTAN